MTDTGKRTYTVAEFARVSGWSVSMIYKHLREGTFPLPVITLGSKRLIPKAKADRFLDGEEDTR